MGNVISARAVFKGDLMKLNKRDLLCSKCGHHIHDTPGEGCHWYDCPCSGQPRTMTPEREKEIRETPWDAYSGEVCSEVIEDLLAEVDRLRMARQSDMRLLQSNINVLQDRLNEFNSENILLREKLAIAESALESSCVCPEVRCDACEALAKIRGDK